MGCGVGRTAILLTTYLSRAQGGSYDGFDTVPHGIKFCQRRITPRFPHFNFQQADIYNRYYKTEGRYKASEIVFLLMITFFEIWYI